MAEQSQGAGRKPAPTRKAAAARPGEKRGVPATGRIVRLNIGQSHGFIRLSDDRDIYFHRSDVPDGVSFNELVVGDSVAFELLEDTVSGARALRVRRRRASR